MIESSSNILDLYNSQFVRNIAIAERDMVFTLLTSDFVPTIAGASSFNYLFIY